MLSRRELLEMAVVSSAVACGGKAQSVPEFDLEELRISQLQQFTAQALVEKYLARLNELTIGDASLKPTTCSKHLRALTNSVEPQRDI
jgi:hypothetical protein